MRSAGSCSRWTSWFFLRWIPADTTGKLTVFIAEIVTFVECFGLSVPSIVVRISIVILLVVFRFAMINPVTPTSWIVVVFYITVASFPGWIVVVTSSRGVITTRIAVIVGGIVATRIAVIITVIVASIIAARIAGSLWWISGRTVGSSRTVSSLDFRGNSWVSLHFQSSSRTNK